MRAGRVGRVAVACGGVGALLAFVACRCLVCCAFVLLVLLRAAVLVSLPGSRWLRLLAVLSARVVFGALFCWVFPLNFLGFSELAAFGGVQKLHFTVISWTTNV